jgi:hypothetical protein
MVKTYKFSASNIVPSKFALQSERMDTGSGVVKQKVEDDEDAASDKEYNDLFDQIDY